MTEYSKPLPKPDPVTQPFWESVKNHNMEIQRCNDTGRFFFYPRGMSPYTLSDNISWQPVSGKGTIYGFTIVYMDRMPGYQGEAPYVVALVELEEGVRMMSHIVNTPPDPDHVKVGMPVEVVYDDVTPEITLPKFQPA